MRKLTAFQPESPSPVSRGDLPCVLAVLFSFLAGIWVSWQRWGNPLIDAGREMNVPLRLLHGETLYSQVRYIYGPLSPYFNSMLYRIFGARLIVLCAGGIAAAAFMLALVYWVARRVLEPAEAMIAVLAGTWICVFKPEGNFILPYAYSALHGSLLTLVVLAISLRYIQKPRLGYILIAGVAAGSAMLAKTEAGIVGLGAGLAAIGLLDLASLRRLLSRLLLFLAPAIAIPAAVYGCIARKIGWDVLLHGNYLFFSDVPWQLIHFNQVRFGFDRPWHSLLLMVVSLIRLLAVGGILASICLFIRPPRPRVFRKAWALLAAGVVICAAASTGLGDLGPMLPMPIVLLALLAAAFVAFLQQIRARRAVDVVSLQWMLILIFSLLSLMRIFLRVSTGGALSSVLIPTTLIVFVYCWTRIFPALFADPDTQRLARRLAMALLLAAIVASAVTLSIRYRRKFNYKLATGRGTMWTQPDLGRAFAEAANYLDRTTLPDDFVAVAPEGTSLNFLCNRRNPLRDEILVPGMLDANAERQAISDLRNSGTRYFLVTNRSTKEFGENSFGNDYDRMLMDWIRKTFHTCAVFGSDPSADPQVGDSRFFIRVYCRK